MLNRQEILEIASECVEYSRSIVVKGTTQLEANNYSRSELIFVRQVLEHIREESLNTPEYAVDVDEAIRYFYESAKLIEKFRVGNCQEMAGLSLLYTLNEYPDIVAEIYYIDGGDHAILVVNRDVNSSKNNPETWGEDCFICDPWANNFYPASEYKEKLKNFYQKNRKNHIEDFNTKKHRLKPIEYLSSTHISKSESNTYIGMIFEKYKNKLKILNDSLETLIDNLCNIADKIRNKYGYEDNKYLSLINKIGQLKLIHISNKKYLDFSSEGKYEEIRTKLEQNLMSSLVEFKQSIKLTDDERNIFGEYRNADSFKTKALMFFNIKPQSQKKIQKYINSSNNIKLN